MKKKNIHPIQILAHLGAWIPFVVIVIDYFNNNLTVNPIQEVTIRTGKTAITLLVLSLACNPIELIFKYKPVLKIKRPLGLYAFYYALLHFLIFILVDYGLNWQFIKEALLEKRYTLIGASAFIILLILAIFSTDYSRRLLKKNWKKIHRFVYLAAILVVIHYIWAVKTDIRLPLVYGGLILILLAFRLPLIRKRILNKK